MISPARSPEMSQPMSPQRMLQIIADECTDLAGEGNVIHFSYRSVPLVLVYDTHADRMRIISAVCRVDELAEGQLQQAMEANFHSALDARYATSDDTVWAAFIHPLSELTERFLRAAIRQVATAHMTFGKEYSSGDLYFGG